MTEEELKKLLCDKDLLKTLDIKSLVLDYFAKKSSMEQIVNIFYEKLPEFDEAYVKRFTYMRRD